MKRICPSCGQNELYYRLFFTHQYMRCNNCASLFKDSFLLESCIVLVNLAIFAALVSLQFIFNLPIYYIAPPVILISFYFIFLIKQKLPIKPIEAHEINLVPPTKVQFEKTESVNENIRRYKEAQKKAIYNKLSEE